MALPAILFAAYQVKRLLVKDWTTTWKNEEQGGDNSDTETRLLLVIYWLCLILATVVIVIDFILLFGKLQELTLLIQISQVWHSAYTSPKTAILLLCWIALSVIVLTRQRIKVLEHADTSLRMGWYILLELPVRMLLDPPFRGLKILSANKIRTTLYLSFYALLYAALVLVCTSLIWKSSLQTSLPTPLGLTYVTFYIMAFVASAIGSAFNWVILHSVEALFTVETQKEMEEEELPIQTVRRIYYTISYVS